jgi:CIC family chloride channel protein
MGRQRRLILDTFLLGIIGGLSAQLFMLLLRIAQDLFLKNLAGYAPPGLPSDHGALTQLIGSYGLWLIPISTTLGGLISGILVYSFAPEAEGHGTDTAVKAYHQEKGFLRTRVPFIKMVASAITIGSGGAAGREGPTALISAGIGSIYATITKRSDEDRRLLVLIGMASGLSAIFRSPIGTAIFAIEVLYGGMEFESVALLYTMLGSVIAYAVNGIFVGWQPLFAVPTGLGISHVSDYLWYILLGLICGPIATLLPVVFYGLRDAFRAIPLPNHIKPAIGGLAIGLLALKIPQVLGGGYGWIQEAINGQLAIGLLGILVFAKLLGFAFTVSSGGSGGVFAPSLFVGVMLGAFIAKVFNQSVPAFAVVGMAAVFGGAARIPIATLLMVTEMTNGYDLLVPAALAVMLSYLIQVTLSTHLKYKSLYEAQVASRAESPAHHVDQVETAIHLLGKRGIQIPGSISHLDLRSLLASGVPVDLPDNKRLALGILHPQSSYVGKTIQESFPIDGQDQIEAVAIFRDGHTLLPHTKLKLVAGDRLLFITSPQRWVQLSSHFRPLNKEEE